MRIQADQLCVDYNGTVALYDASLHLPAGCICGLVGMNGAGKSTFFKALTGFVRPSRGRIRINGSSVAEAQRHHAVTENDRLFLTTVPVDLVNDVGDFLLGQQLVEHFEFSTALE